MELNQFPYFETTKSAFTRVDYLAFLDFITEISETITDFIGLAS